MLTIFTLAKAQLPLDYIITLARKVVEVEAFSSSYVSDFAVSKRVQHSFSCEC